MSITAKQSAFLALVNADYEVLKMSCRANGSGHAHTVHSVEKHWKLKRGQLANFRANIVRRKTAVPDLEWE